MASEKRITRGNGAEPNGRFFFLDNGFQEDEEEPLQSRESSVSRLIIPQEPLISGDLDEISIDSQPQHDLTNSTPLFSRESSMISTTSSQKKAQSWCYQYLQATTIRKNWVSKRGKSTTLHAYDTQYTCMVSPECSYKAFRSDYEGSTSNHIKHLATHGLFPPKPPKSSSPSVMGFLKKQDDPTPKDILAFFISANLPWSTIENPFFRHLIEGPRKNRKLPFKSRQSTRAYAISLLDSHITNLKASLSLTCHTIAISLDCWTSSNGLAFLGVIGHWLTKDFEYKEHMLEFKELQGHHTGELLATTIYSLLEEFGLTTKLISVTSDNATNNESMVACLTEKLKEVDNPFWQFSDDTEEALFNGDHSMVRCFAHILNLVVRKILGVLKTGTISEANTLLDGLSLHIPRLINPLQKIRVIAIWISRSPHRRSSWNQSCSIMKQTNKLIPKDVETRWNSTYYMLETALEKREVVNVFLRLENKLIIQLEEDEWVYLQSLKDILFIFERFTRLVSELEPKINLAAYLYFVLDDKIDDIVSQTSRWNKTPQEIIDAVKASIPVYKKYFERMDVSDLYYMAMVLDPRFKFNILERYFDDEAHLASLKRQLKDKLESLCPIQYQREVDTGSSPLASSKDQKRRLEEEFDEMIFPNLNKRVKQEGSEIDRWFNKPSPDDAPPPIDRDQRKWLLDWWRSNAETWPRLAIAARIFLCIPCSEVAVERLFNQGRDIISLRRSRLNSQSVRALMFLKEDFMKENIKQLKEETFFEEVGMETDMENT